MPDPRAMFDLTGRVALVTGGTRGLGRAIVQAYAEAGADIVVASRKQDACDSVAAEVADSTGRRVVGHAAHVGSWNDLDRLVETAHAEFGHVDILVNNAGMSPLYENSLALTEELFDKVLDINLKGPFRLAAVVASRMREGDGGSIINIGSIAALYPTPPVIPYAAAKAGLNAVTIALAQEYAPKVRVNAIMPGSFRTDVSRSWTPELMAQLESGPALGRIAEPAELVGAALFFASDASSYSTGSLLRVDGGSF
jgi:NAD(P)-dependent dehydrogenase (short-subunit alcohol dehydrogenase family)